MKTKLWRHLAPRMADESGGGGSGNPEIMPIMDENQSGTVDITTSPETPAELPTFSIPEEYREKPFIKNILGSQDPNGELFKQFENLQTMLGKKPKGVPADDAADEEWQQYYESIRPKDKAEYDIPLLEAGEGASDIDKKIIEHLNAQRDDKFLEGVRDILHSEGLTKKQATNIAKKYDQALLSLVKADVQKNIEAQEALNKEFDTYAAEVLGTTDVASAVTKAREALAPLLSEKAKPLLEQLTDNKAAVILLDIGNQVRKTYLKEDSKPIGANAATSTVESQREHARKLMNSPEYLDPTHTRHEAVKREINEIYASISKSL